METSFVVGAIFEIDDQASAALGALGEQFERLGGIIQGVKDKLASFGDISTTAEIGSIESLDKALTGVGDKAAALGTSISSSFAAVGDATRAATEQVDLMAGAFGRLDAAAKTSATAMAAINNYAAGAAARGSRGGAGAAAGAAAAGAGAGSGAWNDASREAYANAQWDNANFNAVNNTARAGANYEAREQSLRAAQAARGFPGGIDDGIGIPEPPTNTWDRYHYGGEPPPERAPINEAGVAAAGGGAASHGSGGLLGGMAEIGEVAAGYESAKQSMEEDLALRNALIEGFHFKDNTPAFHKGMQQLRDTVHTGSEGTIFSESRVAQALPFMARESGFVGEKGLAEFQRVFKPALQAAEVAKMSHLGGLEDSLSASMEYAHMTGTYDPAGVEQRLNVLRSIAQLSRHSMRGEESILKYSVPIGMAAGIGADETAMMTGFLQQRGFNSSTAGTGLSAMILGALRTGGGINAHLESTRSHVEQQLKSALGLKPEEAMAGRARGTQHVSALEQLGIESGGHLTAVDQHGNFDFGKMVAEINHYAASHTHQQVLQALHDAFGVRGERVASTFIGPDSMQQLARYNRAVQTSPTAREIQTDLARSPLQGFEQMVARLADVGNTLATATLPALNGAFQLVTAGLTGLNDFLRSHQHVAEVGGAGMLAAATTALFVGTRAVGRRLLGGLGGVGRGLTGAAEGSEGGAVAAGGSGLIAATGGLAAAGALSYAGVSGLDRASDWLEDKIFGKGYAEAVHRHLAEGNPFVSHHPPPAAPPGAAHPAATPAGAPPAASHATENHIHVQVGPITMSGVADEGTFHKLLDRITDSVKHALSTAAGSAQGTDLSPFVYGAVP